MSKFESMTLMPHPYPDVAHGVPLDDVEQVHETLRAWHNENHLGGYQRCQEQPCLAIQSLDM